MAKRIKVTIEADGTPTIETSGFVGAECEAATKALEESLGARVSNVRTREFNAFVSQAEKAVTRG